MRLKHVCLILLSIVLMSVVLNGCEPETKITFQNQRDYAIHIFVGDVSEDGTVSGLTDYGMIPANSETKKYITFLGNDWVNHIRGVDPSGNIVFAHNYSRRELENLNWTIVIPPLQNK